ncbi:unnamed protein product [Ilex paraguariensis]|uniref:Mo25-like protein n=1 Tax=Ilex paraguariensis TaxID=185542 RepID=A0ABC8QPW9_9AQUA
MKGLFKSKPRTPEELVRQVRDLLIYVDRNTETRENAKKRIALGQFFDKQYCADIVAPMQMSELRKLIMELRNVLYGDDQSEPISKACARVTQEFFKDDTLRLKLDSGTRQAATHVVANLQRQRIKSQSIAADYMEQNIDLLDTLVQGYEDSDIALSYGTILRDCIRHQVIARYVLESEHMKKFFEYVQNPSFEIASDAAATFKFFQEFNTKLLESPTYITRRHALKMFLDSSKSSVMVRYVSSLDNLRILMNLLRDSNKSIQLEAFHVFKIVSVLLKNRTKLLQFLGDFRFDKEDEQFAAAKARVVKEIVTL